MDIKNYQIQCIKCLDHDNLVRYLNNHDYTLEASILHRTEIDGREFLEVTESELRQYKLNRQQVELILSCRDFMLGKKSKMNRNSSTKKASEAEENLYMDMNKIIVPEVPLKPLKVENRRESDEIRTKPKLVKSSHFYVPEPSKLNFSQMKALHSDKSIDEAIVTVNKMVSVEDTDYIETENVTNNIKQQISNVCYQNLKAVMVEMEAFNKRASEAYQKSSEAKVDAWQKNNNRKSYSPLMQNKQEISKKYANSLAHDDDFLNQELADEELWNNRRWLPPPEFSDDSVDLPIITVSDSGDFPRPPPFVESDPEHIKLVKDLLKDYKVSQRNCPYYRNTDRQGVKELLQKIPNLKDGFFLFRNSEEYFLVITIYHQGSFCHSGVNRNSDGNFYCEIYGEQGKSTFEFETLNHFVEHFKRNPLVVKLNDVRCNIYLREMNFDEFILTI